MQENIKKVKRDKALNTFAIILLLFVFFASLVLALCAPLFTSNGVASALDVALPNTGIVGENLLKHTDMSHWDFNLSGSTRVDLFKDDSVYLGSSGSNSYTLVSNKLSSTIKSTAGKYANLRFRLYDSSISGAYTFTSYASSIVGNFGMQCWGYNSAGQPTNIGSVHFNLSSGINSFTYNLDGSFSYYLFIVQTYDEVTLDWVKVEKGSSFTGYVSDYKTDDLQNQLNQSNKEIENLHNQLNQANADKNALQGQYNSLLDSMDFSTFNSVDLNSTKPLIASTTMGNSIGSSTTSASYNGVTYGGYWYYRNSVENDPYSMGLAEFDIGSTLLAGSDIKISYDALFPYNGSFADNVGVVLSFSNFGVYSSASNFKVVSVFIPAADFISREFIYKFDFDVNYITFGVGTFDSSSNTFNDITLGYDINSSVKQGIFISNFVVSGRGANFNVAIENANKQGYNKGYQEGKVAGETIGYQLGVKDQGDYTFMGLLGAVFDAPIKAFKGLLNFEILGVDMTAFVSSLFALAIIVVIIKISLGGK